MAKKLVWNKDKVAKWGDRWTSTYFKFVIPSHFGQIHLCGGQANLKCEALFESPLCSILVAGLDMSSFIPFFSGSGSGSGSGINLQNLHHLHQGDASGSTSTIEGFPHHFLSFSLGPHGPQVQPVTQHHSHGKSSHLARHALRVAKEMCFTL